MMTQQEVATILGVTRAAVAQTEWRALAKMRRHPILKQLAEDYGITITRTETPREQSEKRKRAHNGRL